LLPEEITFNVDQVFKFVDNIDVPQNKKKKFEKLELHYLANGYIILPEDGYKIIMAEKIARIKKVDPFSFKNPNQIMELMPDELAKNSFNPDETESFTNKKVLSNGVVVYDVAHTDQGQKDVRLAIDRDFGKKANPWCLAVKNEKGELSSGAKQMWKTYNDGGNGYKIAFQNGKLTGLRDGNSKQWWDRKDRPSEGVPITRKTKDGWKEYITLKKDGTKGKVTFKTKGSRNNGRYVEKTSADELMYGSSNDFVVVEDITYKDGKPMDGFIKKYGSEDNFSLQEYVGGVKVKSLHDSSSEYVNNNMNEIAYFGDKAIKIKVDKGTEEDILNEKGETNNQFIKIIEGVDTNGDRIVYKELHSRFVDTRTGVRAYPKTIYKELNGDKYLTQWDLNFNELVESVIYQTKNLTKDQLEAEYLKTNAAKAMSLEHFKNKGYSYDYLRTVIKNHKLEKGKAAFDKNDKKIIVPVNEKGDSLRFSMNTRMDLNWKKKSTELDFLNYTMDTHTTTFTLDGNEYEIKMVKMLQEEAAGNLGQITAPEGNYYDVSFTYIDEDGVPHIDITGKAGKKSGTVISIITNGVLDFVRNNKVDGLTYSSKEVNRTKLYNTLTNLFASELGWGKRVNEVVFDPAALDPELSDLYSDMIIGAQNDFTEFTVSKHLPVKKDLTNQRKPVRDVMRTIDKGSPTQTNNIRYSKSNLNKTFNHIIESKTGIAAEKTFDEVAKGIGKKKGKYKFFMPYSAEDFIGLMYPLLSKGKLGDKQMEWFNTVLFKPFARAMENVSKDRNQIMRDFRELKKNLKNVPKNLRKEAIPGLTYENAVRIYLWDKQGWGKVGLGSRQEINCLEREIEKDIKMEKWRERQGEKC